LLDSLLQERENPPEDQKLVITGFKK